MNYGLSFRLALPIVWPVMRYLPSRRILPATLASLLLALSAALQAEPRVFTDTQGRTLKADLLEAGEETIRVRRDDGSLFNIPIDTLSQADRDYITDWLDAQITAAATRMRINVSKFKDTISKSEGISTKYRTEAAGYLISLFNESMTVLDGLRIDYRIYMVRQRVYSATDPRESRSGTIPVEPIDRKSKIDVKTTTLTLERSRLKSDWYYLDSNKRGSADQLDGIWLRVYRGKTLVAEYVTSEDLKRENWDPPQATRPSRNSSNADK